MNLQRFAAKELVLMKREYLILEETGGSPTDGAMSAISDEAILHSSQERPSLFGVLVDRYQAPFLRLAQRVVRERTAAEDVVQEAFLKIYRYAHSFKKGQDRKFSSWAYKIVMNTAITHYHKLRKREWLLPEDTDPTADEARVQYKEAVLERETQAVVGSVLDVMPEELRSLLKAYYLEDKSYKTIAEAENMSMGALKMKLFRARRLFRKLIT